MTTGLLLGCPQVVVAGVAGASTGSTHISFLRLLNFHGVANLVLVISSGCIHLQMMVDK